MSDIAATARVSVFLSDYAAADSAGKMNVLGAGWQVTALEPPTGATPAHALVVLIETHPSHYGDSFALEVALYGPDGELAQVPGPAGLMPLRMGQNVLANRPTVPNQALPPDLWSHAQVVMAFPGGLTLAPGTAYTWRVRIDNDSEHEWATTFYVVGPQPGPVVG